MNSRRTYLATDQIWMIRFVFDNSNILRVDLTLTAGTHVMVFDLIQNSSFHHSRFQNIKQSQAVDTGVVVRSALMIMKDRTLTHNLLKTGICDVNLENGTSVLVEFLRLANMEQFRRFIQESSVVMNELAQWRHNRINIFDIFQPLQVDEKSNNVIWFNAQISRYVFKEVSMTAEELELFITLPEHYIGLHRGYLSWILAMYAVFQNPEIPWQNFPVLGEPLFRGYQVENWDRAYEFVPSQEPRFHSAPNERDEDWGEKNRGKTEVRTINCSRIKIWIRRVELPSR